MSEIQVRVEGTPNPNAAKFVLDRPLIGEGGGRSYFDAESARGDALAERLFGVEGVRAVFMVEDFITVTKTDQADWDDLVDGVKAAIREELRQRD